MKGGEKSMEINEYQKLAMETSNKELSWKEHLLNGVMGMCGEAGECIDMVKKTFMQGHELDDFQLAKELGDVLWYIVETANAIDRSLKDIMQINVDKLKKRYPCGFDKEKSKNRLENDT